MLPLAPLAPVATAVVSGIWGVIQSLIPKIISDPEKQVEAQLKLAELAQSGELAQLAAQAQIITAEAQGGFLQRNWRPVLMLTFAGLIVARWLGYAAPNITEAETLKLWSIVEIGLGGYVIGRSAEKVLPVLADAIKR